MLDIHKIRSSNPRNTLFTSIDISNAFYHIPIHPRFQKFLAFTHDNQLYTFHSMPFGIKLEPLILTKVISEMLKRLHKDHVAASVYIDDWILWSKSHLTLVKHTARATSLLNNLGFTINCKNSQLIPLQSITYLDVR